MNRIVRLTTRYRLYLPMLALLLVLSIFAVTLAALPRATGNASAEHSKPTRSAYWPSAAAGPQTPYAALVITAGIVIVLSLLYKSRLALLQDWARNALLRRRNSREELSSLLVKRRKEFARQVGHFTRRALGRKSSETEIGRDNGHLHRLVAEQGAGVVGGDQAAELVQVGRMMFLANLAHELRTQLQVILSLSGLGRRTIDTATLAQLQTYFVNIEKGGKDLLVLINDLLDLSKFEAGKMVLDKKPLDLAQLAEEISRELEPLLWDQGLSFDFLKPTCSTIASLDRTRIGQVLRNLYSNAIKFSPPGGRITVRIDPAPQAMSDDSSIAEALPALRLTVSDHGIGIPDGELDAVFGKYVQSSATRPQALGTGLGLAICKEIIDAHGGQIRARNSETGGAVFEVVLPGAESEHHGEVKTESPVTS